METSKNNLKEKIIIGVVATVLGLVFIFSILYTI